MEESKLIFSMDHHDEGPTVVFSRDKPARENWPDLSLGSDFDLGLGQGHHDQTPILPHSPSSPGSLADLSASSADQLVYTNLVKSSSTDLGPRGSSSRRGKPLLSLVKSLSTEISRRVEPDVNLSKSDSRLHLHPRKQPRIPEARFKVQELNENDGWESPPSTGSISPTEPRGSSLIAELEDTRRKFSEAMQDPLSMLSKIMGDENSSPKQHRAPGGGDSPFSLGSLERDGSREDADLKSWRRADREHRGGCDSPLRRIKKGSFKKNPASPEHHMHSREGQIEICTYGDMIQVSDLQRGSRAAHCRTYKQNRGLVRGSSLPLHWLFLVGFLSYGFFVLPLPSYVTGLSLGVACGFMLGLGVVFTFAPRRSRRNSQFGRPTALDPLDGKFTDPEVLEGWMNETHSYDPDTFHPSITHSVYGTLEGSRLRLAYPLASNETSHEAVFCRSCTFRLVNSKVSLAPPGLARKRLWNKKYPICITLAEGEVGEDSLIEGQEEEDRAERHAVSDHQLPVTLYLFGRTGREKEEWFQHFLSASRTGARARVSSEENTDPQACAGDAVRESAEQLQELPGAVRARTLLEYSTYMTQLMATEGCIPSQSPGHSDTGSPIAHRKIHNDEHGSESQTGAESSPGSGAQGCSAEGEPTWVNSLLGRICWDFLRDKYWTDQVAHKIQKKLSKIKLPYFMNELTLAGLDMGSCLPQVLSTSKPTLDRRGLWLELELMYTGCLQMTLETKMNLCKLGKEDEAHGLPETEQVGSKPRICLLADSDEESSSAGSSDEDDIPPAELLGPVGDKSTAADVHTGGSTSRKILRFVDKITKSKYFQKATENEYIRKKIAEVSNMPLLLSVEVLELSGTLAINIPPPPTDRIWYSFKVPPKLDLHVRPMLGEREVTFTHVTEWIERKLQCEFQKVFVMPNMDDIYLPLMTSGLANPPTSRNSSVHSSSHQSSMESQEYLSE